MRKKSDAIASIFLILVGMMVILGSLQLRLGTPTEPQPGFFPFVASAVLVFLCCILLFKALLGRSSGGETFGELCRPGILMIGLFIYSVVLDILGYVLATFILSGIILRVLDTKSWWKIIVVGLILSVGTYILFDRLLDVSLPAGILAGFK